MKYLFILVSGMVLTLQAAAQGDPEQVPTTGNEKINTASNRIYGKIVDEASTKPVEAVSAQLFVKGSTGADSLIRGMLTRANGDFAFENLPDGKFFRVLITAVGYEEISREILVTEANLSDGHLRYDLGNVTIEQAVKQLSAVVVTAARPALEMGIDRKVFNASKSLVSTGGTAVDLMKNIPSVSVDVDGNVTLRNSSPQIFVDGRPTILTLDQIPADNIERVELITNPSAKFDAASSGGIINIVLKKNKRVGMNGVATLSVGTPSVLNTNLNLNLRQGRFNFFLTGGINQSGGVARSEAERINRKNGQPTDYFNQVTETDRKRIFRSLRFGTDFFIDNRNTLSFTQQIGGGHSNWMETQRQDYLDINKDPNYYGDRLSYGKQIFRRNSSVINYKHNFPRAGSELTADINYNYGNRSEGSDIYNSFVNPDGTANQPSSYVQNTGKNSNDQVIVQVDFVNPMGESRKLEGGLRSYHNTFNSLYDVYSIGNGSQTKLPLSNHYEYTEMVNALYLTYSEKIKTFSYQVGLRSEYSKFDGTLVDSAFKFGYEYPAKIKNIWNALFPSVFLTKELTEKTQIQFNYSRRIRRPDFWQMNPAIDISDPANLRQGNLQLRPEFINSFEFNLSQNYKQGNLLAVLYFRNNPDDITQYSDTITAAQYAQLQNAAISPNAILNTFINANTTNRYGAEFTLQHKLSANFNLTPTVNLQYRTVNARVGGQNLSNDGFNWDAKLIAEYKITPTVRNVFSDLSFQLLGEYESAEVIAQGKNKAQYSMDFAMRKDLLKDKKGTITFGVNDVFNTNRWGTIYDTENFYQDSYRRWNVRSVRITFSYRFGDANFSLAPKNRRQGGDE